MFDYSSLQSLVDGLERGNRFHICIVFFSRHTGKKLMVSRRTAIHANPVCDAAKLRPHGMARCLRCRGLMFQKARRIQQPFGGYCINGVYEYCHPVFLEDRLYCVICIGNILRDRERLCDRIALASEDPLLDTMETDIDDAECERIAAIVESYIRMLLQHTQTPSSTQGNAVLWALRAELDRYFSQDITLGEMARLYHYNEKYLGRLFKTQFGVSFAEYLNRKRLSYAAARLRQTGESVLDISQKAGFNNVTYFNRLFREKYGQSPSQYRKEQG